MLPSTRPLSDYVVDVSKLSQGSTLTVAHISGRVSRQDFTQVERYFGEAHANNMKSGSAIC